MENWQPQIGDTVYYVVEFMIGEFTKERLHLEEYDDQGYEVVSASVLKSYHWKNGDPGIVVRIDNRLIGSNANNLDYFRLKDYGKKVFSNPKDAVKLAEEKTRYAEIHYAFLSHKPKYRHWLH